MEQSWVMEIREQCLAAGVPFFFKQWGGANKKKASRLLDGLTWEGLSATFTAPQLAARFV
jgi:protein gp37